MIVYLLTNTVNGKRYVGKTARSVEQRWAEHVLWAARNYSSRRSNLYRAIRKYSPKVFTRSILSVALNADVLNTLERFWISELKTKAPTGYNLTDGGEGASGNTWSNESRARMSRSSTGRQQSPETRAKISAAGRGRKHTPETLEKLRGRKVSPEGLQNLRRAAQGRKPSAAAHEASRIACTGKKRPPFSQETRDRLRSAALADWARRKANATV